jgi:hypothetical protein
MMEKLKNTPMQQLGMEIAMHILHKDPELLMELSVGNIP